MDHAQPQPQLLADLARRQRPDQTHPARRAEGAAHGAADLGGDAERRRGLAARRLRDEHGLDPLIFADVDQQFGRAVGRSECFDEAYGIAAEGLHEIGSRLSRQRRVRAGVAALPLCFPDEPRS